jgi:hypothetical protein
MSDCYGHHSWEVYSGDYVVCVECDAEGRVDVTYEPEDDE